MTIKRTNPSRFSVNFDLSDFWIVHEIQHHILQRIKIDARCMAHAKRFKCLILHNNFEKNDELFYWFYFFHHYKTIIHGLASSLVDLSKWMNDWRRFRNAEDLTPLPFKVVKLSLAFISGLDAPNDLMN